MARSQGRVHFEFFDTNKEIKMVTKLQKKQQKQKARDKENRKKITAKRMASRAKAKADRDEELMKKRVGKLQREMAGTEMDNWDEEMLKKMPEDTLEQLERNAKILNALEDEHEEETAKKQELNEGLEAKGHVTLEEKVNALHQNTVEEQKKKFGLTGEADCKMYAAPKPKIDTAEVGVTRINED